MNFSALATPTLAVSQPVLNTVSDSGTARLSFTFTNTPGASSQFTVWNTTNLALPFSLWVNEGHSTEVSAGTYDVIDTQATNKSQQYYKVTSP